MKKAYTMKAFNKRRFRSMLYIYAQIFLFTKTNRASRRYWREKELEKVLKKYPQYCTFES